MTSLGVGIIVPVKYLINKYLEFFNIHINRILKERIDIHFTELVELLIENMINVKFNCRILPSANAINQALEKKYKYMDDNYRIVTNTVSDIIRTYDNININYIKVFAEFKYKTTKYTESKLVFIGQIYKTQIYSTDMEYIKEEGFIAPGLFIPEICRVYQLCIETLNDSSNDIYLLKKLLNMPVSIFNID